MRVWEVFQKWCLEVASDVGGNGTAVLVITMGHGEGREQAGSVDGARMLPREPSASSKTEPKCAPFSETKVH